MIPWLLSLLLSWVAAAVVLIIIDRLNIGLKVGSFTTALAAAFVIAVTNVLLGTLLQILALPLNLISLGCLSWLFSWIINAVVLYVAAKFVKGFEILNFVSAMMAALVMGILNWGIGWLLTQLNL